MDGDPCDATTCGVEADCWTWLDPGSVWARGCGYTLGCWPTVTGDETGLSTPSSGEGNEGCSAIETGASGPPSTTGAGGRAMRFRFCIPCSVVMVGREYNGSAEGVAEVSPGNGSKSRTAVWPSADAGD